MITLQNLGFYYKKGKPVLDDISTELEPGKIYGLLGLNGVGKTTLLKVIAGLRFPKYGDIEVNGHTPGHRSIPFLSDMMFVPDEITLPGITVGKYEKLYRILYPKFDAGKFEKLLKDFKVDRTERINNLSFGQQKKMYMAFALATNTRVLLLDEPTNGLDIPSKRQFRKALSSHISDETLVIISSHQIRDLHSVIDHILVLDNSKLVVNGSISRLASLIGFTSSPVDRQRVLYSETLVNGDHYMVENTMDMESDFDIEMFFNAIIHRPEILRLLPNLN